MSKLGPWGNRVLALVSLVFAPIFMLPGLALAWYRLKGMAITMHPALEAIVWVAVIAGASTLIQGVLLLIRGR